MSVNPPFKISVPVKEPQLHSACFFLSFGSFPLRLVSFGIVLSTATNLMWGILVAIVTIGIVVVSYETFYTETNFPVHNCETSYKWDEIIFGFSFVFLCFSVLSCSRIKMKFCFCHLHTGAAIPLTFFCLVCCFVCSRAEQ